MHHTQHTKASLTIAVPANAVGCLMGRRGAQIQRMRRASGALLFFNTVERGSREDRVLTVLGSPAQVSEAQRLVVERLTASAQAAAAAPTQAALPGSSPPPSPLKSPPGLPGGGGKTPAAPVPPIRGTKLEAVLRGLRSCHFGPTSAPGRTPLQKLEEAHWTYLDFYVPRSSPGELPRCADLLAFGRLMAALFPEFEPYVTKKAVHAHRMEMASRTRCGAIVLNAARTRCVLVKSVIGGADVYTFPRGKVEPGETDVACAVREVLEETGADIRSMVDPRLFITTRHKGRLIKLFVVAGLPERTKLRPACPGQEVAKAEWFDLCDLETLAAVDGPTAHKSFRCIAPAVQQLLRLLEGAPPQPPAAAAARRGSAPMTMMMLPGGGRRASWPRVEMVAPPVLPVFVAPVAKPRPAVALRCACGAAFHDEAEFGAHAAMCFHAGESKEGDEGVPIMLNHTARPHGMAARIPVRVAAY